MKSPDFAPHRVFEQGSRGKKMSAQRPPAMPPAQAPSLIQWSDLPKPNDKLLAASSWRVRVDQLLLALASVLKCL